MRNLILLFLRNGGFILFLLLEGICFFLVVRFNRTQNQIFFNSSNRISGNIYRQFDELTKFYNLSSVADSLARENAQLYATLDEAQLTRSPWRDTMKIKGDTLPMYAFSAARILNNSVSQHDNNLTINLGEKHGIRAGMGVISKNGIVGIVKNTSSNFAHVMSVLHKQSKISAAIQSNGYFGFLVWPGSNPRKAKLIDVPKDAKVEVGDTVITSGYSTIFPKGLMIGTVNDFVLKSGSNAWDIEVSLSNNLANIEYVYVVENLLREELEQLTTEE